MKRLALIFLGLIILLCGCSKNTNKHTDENNEYMGMWRIYTSSNYRDVSIGNFEIYPQKESEYTVKITDFDGGVDISVLKTMKAESQAVLTGVETIKKGTDEITVKAYLMTDTQNEKTIKLEFINQDGINVLESLYLYR